MTYFAADKPEVTASVLMEKANNWYHGLNSNGYLDKLKKMLAAYHGAYLNGSHEITFGGEQGELVNLNVNHLRNIARHIHTMVVSNRPALQARATNTDYKSLAQSKLANDLLDYYLREKRLEKYLESAVESAIIQASGYIKMSWNSTSGEIYDYNEELNTPIYEGDVEFSNLSPFDVVFDPTKDSTNFDWVLCRTFKNKYDIIAKYPEHKDKIEQLQTKDKLFNFRFDNSSLDETDDIPVYEFFHKRTESMPDGRYLLFLSSDLVLLDMALPYRDIPIYRISPSTIMGTPYGYSDLFDVLPIQEAINALYSVVFTNQHTFGVQSIYVPRGADINIKSLEGGLNIIEGNAGAGKPEPVNFTATPPEVFNFIKQLEAAAETISGVNSVARGNPEASLKSGAALALVQSMALQFISGLQQAYVQLLEDVGTGLINMLKDFADVPRIALIAGKDNRTYVKTEFKGDDLSQINRVIVDVGNALAKTTSGKLQIASELIQYGIIKTPEQYMSILSTGRLDTMTDDTQRELLLIKGENERLTEGQYVPAIAIDQHAMHIKGHRAALADTELRDNPEIVAAVLNHINEHITLLETVKPSTLAIIGEQALQPANPPMSPVPQENLNQSAGSPAGGAEMAPPTTGALPGMPNMPAVPAEALPNPELQAQAMGNVRG
jgi:carbon monoxide dehydrogenase subunit G